MPFALALSGAAVTATTRLMGSATPWAASQFSAELVLSVRGVLLDSLEFSP